MFSETDLTNAIREIAERALKQFDTAHPDMCLSLLKAEQPDLVARLADRLADKQLRDRFRNELSGRVGSGRGEQLELPGVGAIERRITVSDGEGGYAYKLIAKATVEDLLADYTILHDNAEAATSSANRAELRNNVLIPTMQAHGFATAGDALRFLGATV